MKFILTFIVFIIIMVFIMLYAKHRKKTNERFKPITMIIPADTDDLFVDVEMLQGYRKSSPLCEQLYEGIVLGFGKNIFVFDMRSCDFLTWARYVGGEPKMEICEVEEVKI